jgi:hypothetical protein
LLVARLVPLNRNPHKGEVGLGQRKLGIKGNRSLQHGGGLLIASSA